MREQTPPGHRVICDGRPLSVRVLPRPDAEVWPGIDALGTWNGFVFQSREFLDLWVETIGAARGSRCCFVVVSESDRPVFLLPLCIERRKGVALLRFMDGGVSDYNAPIIRPGWTLAEDAFRALWRAIRDVLPRFDAVELRKISARAGDAASPLISLPGLRVVGGSRGVDASGSWAEYLEEPSRKRHHSVTQRKLRALERLGPVTVEAVTDPARAAAVSAFLFDHKIRQYQRTTGWDPFGLPGYRAFFTRLTQAPYLGHLGRLSAITCGERLAAAHLGYQDARRFYQIMPVYDAEHFAAASPGRIHLEHMIRSTFEADLDAFEFGEGLESYKDLWTTQSGSLLLHTDGHTLLGRTAVWLNTRRRDRDERRISAAPASQSESAMRRNASAARGNV